MRPDLTVRPGRLRAILDAMAWNMRGKRPEGYPFAVARAEKIDGNWVVAIYENEMADAFIVGYV